MWHALTQVFARLFHTAMFEVRDENRHGFVINVTYAAREVGEHPLFYTAKVIYHKFRQIHTERLIKRFIIEPASNAQ